MSSLFEAYITNAGKYAEGQPVGETLRFPTALEEVQSLLKRIGVDGVRHQEIPDQRIQCKFRIAVDERDTRCRIVSATDAFSIGCQLPAELLSRYRIVSVRVTDVGSGLYYIIRQGEERREEIVRYLELLSDEVNAL